jgi:hypothetical protein
VGVKGKKRSGKIREPGALLLIGGRLDFIVTVSKGIAPPHGWIFPPLIKSVVMGRCRIDV